MRRRLVTDLETVRRGPGPFPRQPGLTGVSVLVVLGAAAVLWLAVGAGPASPAPGEAAAAETTVPSVPRTSPPVTRPAPTTAPAPAPTRPSTTSRPATTPSPPTTHVFRPPPSPPPVTYFYRTVPTYYYPPAPVTPPPTSTTTTSTTIAPIGGHLPVPPSTLPLRTKAQSAHVSLVFAALSGVGFLVAFLIMAGRFIITRPSRKRGTPRP